ncbi:MAG: hydroxymethylbilane synthase [Gammaproteobacteria bacterium]|nr:hydroxymethylbilane synthase [Gammaproteobacteria bacterium]
MTLTIATRRSPLALWQSEHCASLLAQITEQPVQLLELSTRGDELLDRSLAAIGGKGLFLKELEHALLDGRADLAVHSMKDVPAEMHPELCLAANLPRATPWDAFVSNAYADLDSLPEAAIVGTSSPRRQIQVMHRRPDLQCLPVRGNVQTRLQRLDDGDCHALLLACAGLERLGLDERITGVLRTPDWIPAAAQGVVTVQCRRDDQRMRDLLAQLHDAANADLISAERLIIERLQGDCHTPLGVYAEALPESNDVILHGVLGSDPEQGQPGIARAQVIGARADISALADRLAQQLSSQLESSQR